MDTKAMYRLSYGLFVLTTKLGARSQGCIVNTAIQVTTTPNRISVTVNQQNLTHDVLLHTGQLNLSVLSEAADFSVFRHFGFQSGRDCDKFASYPYVQEAANGIPYVTHGTNAYLSGTVVQTIDLGTHTMFLVDVTDGAVLSDVPSATYAYYQTHIKPRPAEPSPADGKKGYRCRICGYVYEGETLPEDFVCPICKHDASDFEKIGD
jgi:flavin reductase (DIM6/NTAB) family NADH-FMN oxidoreductase RutF/rubredoxin